MSVNIKDILNLEVKREQQIISGLNELQVDDQSKQEIREKNLQHIQSSPTRN